MLNLESDFPSRIGTMRPPLSLNMSASHYDDPHIGHPQASFSLQAACRSAFLGAFHSSRKNVPYTFCLSLADPFSALSAFQVSTHRSSSFLIPIRKEPNTVTDYNTTLPFSQGTPRFSLRFLSQIANFPRIYCSNSTLLTSFRVPMYKTNGQFGIFSKESIL